MKPGEKPKPKMVGIRLEAEVWEQVKAQARKEDRTLTKWVDRALRSALARSSRHRSA